MSVGYQFNIRSKGQGSTSQDLKCKKDIEGDREAGVNALYRVPPVKMALSINGKVIDTLAIAR